MGLFSLAKLFGITIRESATDGSDFTNPDADYRRLFLGEDGQLHLKDSAGAVTDIGGGSGAVATDSIWDAKGDLAGGTGANTAARLAVGTNDHTLIAASGETTGLKWGQLPGTLLACTAYAPTTQTIYTSTNTAMEDVDATNMIVTFTAPASGIVLIRLSAYGDTAVGDTYWGLRESTTNLAVGRAVRAGTGLQGYVSMPFRLTGVTGGSHTYKWSFGVGAGATGRIIVMDGSAIGEWTPGFMEVYVGL